MTPPPTAAQEREKIVAWLRDAAHIQREAAVDLVNSGLDDGFYNGDAYFRITALATAIEAGEHLKGSE